MNNKFNISDQLYKGTDGIWYSKNKSDVNYPKDGNIKFSSVEEESFWYIQRNKIIIEVLNKFKPIGYVYDIGGGNGYVSAFLQKNGYNMVLVEPDRNGIIASQKRGLEKLICCELNEFYKFDNVMDNIVMFDVLEHIKNDNDTLALTRKILKPNGFLCLTVPANQFLFSLEDFNDKHFRRYYLKDLKNKIEQNGFKVLYHSYFFSYLILPMFMMKTLPTKLKIGSFKSLEYYQKKNNVEFYKSEHKLSFIINYIIKSLNRIELIRIRKSKSIPVGTSCIVLAKPV